MTDQWLPTLITNTPQEGYELAITLSRRGVAKPLTHIKICRKTSLLNTHLLSSRNSPPYR